MKIMLLPSAVSPEAGPLQFLTSFLINDTVVLDAGTIGFFRTPREQACIKHIFITHSHIDHVASLPIFLENAYEGTQDCVTIHGSSKVIDSLQFDVFNDRLWPDFIRLSSSNTPFLKLNTLAPDQTIEVEGLRLTPVTVNHTVHTMGFIIEDDHCAVVFPSDTGPTDEIWRRANRTPNLKAVFLEATFPASMARLADISKHLTPALFAAEVKKLHVPAKIFAVHIKPRFREEVVKELAALAMPNLEIARPGFTYEF